ncbi:hypothetical protein V6N13_113694 [Hibiscus sabdariffa]
MITLKSSLTTLVSEILTACRLSMGVLNLAIVIPQVVVSLGSGPWDQLFGGGNSPAFAVAGVAALTGGFSKLCSRTSRRRLCCT